MMDCRTAFDYMMKYLDKDMTQREEKLLFEHLDSCEGCMEEFEALRAACSMLDEVEMEEPPEGFQESVMGKIESRHYYEKSPWGLMEGALLLGVFIMAWMGLALLLQYTPILAVAAERFKDIEAVAGSLLKITASFLYGGLIGLSKLFSLGRAFGIAERAVIEACSTAIMAAAAGLALILLTRKYMYRIIRR